MRTVVDASALIDALLPVPGREAAIRAMRGRELWAPGILDLEVASAVARLERAGAITTVEADAAITDLASVPLERVPTEIVAPAAWHLRGSLRIADAMHVAVARHLDADLLTADARLAQAPRLGVTVTLLSR